ncbi:hypothetical protein A3B57_01550 [Microgenomates group bacterium RIFCSPLOWO2_01_FULL_47_10]|nr:MAG: hypothetical protein A3B57_01550 [Microgenomates group bacterium RIFCSPLOWO2_01_FULL_47_10]
MRVFFVIDEAYPLYKIGGLGDVGGSLPKALSSLGVDVSVILPLHPTMTVKIEEYVFAGKFNISYGDQILPITVSKSLLPGTTVPVYVIGEDIYISKDTDAGDNHADKFAVFSLAVATFIHTLPPDQQPQLVHLHDWHTALIPLISRHLLNSRSKYLLTIHNLMYQGVTYTPIIEKLHIPKSACQLIDWDIQDHNINILLEGILHADSVNTVSVHYAKEILTSEYGEHINEIIASHQKPIHGITNGLDTVDFNPTTDKSLYQTYDLASYQSGKTANKKGLQRELGLPESGQPLLGFVGRVDANQKGIQLIIEAIKQNQLTPGDRQFVFLGTGDQNLERQLHDIADHRIGVRIITRYDESLARKIYAASDLLLIPSKFEPCGLIQMIANRYGTLPVAHATGGLIDTIEDNGNGFLFEAYDTASMLEAIGRGITALGNPETAKTMITKAMNRDFSWGTAALAYRQLYQSIINQN